MPEAERGEGEPEVERLGAQPVVRGDEPGGERGEGDGDVAGGLVEAHGEAPLAGPTRSIFMMTVVDQVRPWLTPSRTLAKMTQPHVGAHINSSGTGMPMSQPAIEHRLAAEAIRQGAGEEVGGRLDDAEGDDERERRGERGEPELLLGEQRQDGTLLADHPADERIHADQQQELGEVLA